MTDSPPADAPAADAAADTRPYSPGLEGVVAAESAIGLVDGINGRLLYRGYPIGQLVKQGSYAEVADLLWTGEWHPGVRMACAPLPIAVLRTLRELPADAVPMDALRTAVSVWGATQKLTWPPTVEQARALTAFSPSALAAFGRLRQGLEPVDPDPSLDLVEGFLYQLNGVRPDAGTARALDAYFVVGAEHGLNASTFTARVITATRSDIASAVCGAIGRAQGTAPRRGTLGGRRSAQQGRLAGTRRAVDQRGARPRRAADGLRAPGLPGLRPTRCRPA